MRTVIGIDEVGRGAWAGPLVVGAVSLRIPIPGLTDSKLLKPDRREYFHEIIEREALYHSTGWVSAEEIDSIGLTAATSLAIKRALEDIQSYDKILIDGNYNYLPDESPEVVETIIGGDLSIPEISAASILAKVRRDRWMALQSAVYPDYDFENNVGYHSKRHVSALTILGPTELHRKSFKIKALRNYDEA